LSLDLTGFQNLSGLNRLFQRVADQLRIECANVTPEFITLCIEEDKSGREFETVHGGKFPADGFLNVQAYDVNLPSDADLIIKFLLEPVNGGLNLGAGNSIGGLEFEENGCASANEGLHLFGVVHQRSLDRVQNDPGGDQCGDDNPKGKKIVPFWLIGE
jgi:hypothetical protein